MSFVASSLTRLSNVDLAISSSANIANFRSWVEQMPWCLLPLFSITMDKWLTQDSKNSFLQAEMEEVELKDNLARQIKPIGASYQITPTCVAPIAKLEVISSKRSTKF